MMYDHYIGIDWAQKNVAVSRMTKVSNKIETFEGPASVKDVVTFIQKLKGTKILTVEETTTAQWLYTEFKPYVDELVICDPHRNRLLSDGPKTDKIDAEKLVKLLRADLLKPVFHSGDKFIYMRKLVSSYTKLVQAGVRLKNQRSALFRAYGQNHKTETDIDGDIDSFVLKGLDIGIELYTENKKSYEEKFQSLCKSNKIIRNLTDIPGISKIGAVKITAYVVDATRFKTKANFLSYSGLIKLDRVSGGHIYGRKKPRYCRPMKDVFKIAALAAIRSSNGNFLSDYYQYLISEKNYTGYNARHAVARRAAVLAYGIMKSQKKLKVDKGRLQAQKNSN